MPELDTTSPVASEASTRDFGQSRVSALWEAVKRFPSALPGGAMVGAVSGSIMAAGAYMLGDVSFIGHLIEQAGGPWSLAAEFAATHALGHAAYDGIIESKATYDKATHHNDSLAVREAMAEEAMAKAVEQGIETPVQAVESGFFDREPEAAMPRSRAMEAILARGSQAGQQVDWKQRIAAQEAERAAQPPQLG